MAGVMNYSDEGYRNMIASFRTNDLQTLLAAFGGNKNGRKSELKDRALDLLRSRQPNFSHQAYIAKIVEIYRSMTNEGSRNNDLIRSMIQTQQRQQMMTTMGMGMSQGQVQQQRMYQPQYSQPQTSMHMTRAGLPQVMPQMQRNIYGNTISGGSSNIQYGYQPSGSRSNMVSQMPVNQQLSTINSMVPPDPMVYDMNASTSGSSFTQSTPSLANIRLKKLPFYEVIAEVIKPTILVGQERCTLQNVPRGMREASFKLTMLPEHVNEVTLNRDVSGGKNEFIYQIQMRICLLETGATEITDYMPLGLHARISNKVCPLPPTPPNTRPGTETRRIPRPINCTQVLKLNPNVANPISINWSPDAKTYVIAMYLVKKLTSDILLQKLKDKGGRSSEETKNYIINKLSYVDPDVATTSYRFSLVCPLGKMRMKMPAKSINCDHLQCFDASIFILMNEKKPTWMCPTCNKSCLYDDIQIENYFLEVVSSPILSDSCKEIEILADGSWKVYVEPKEAKNVETAAESKEKPIDSVNLDDSDDGGNDENPAEVKKESKAESSKDSENIKSSFVDLTLSDGEEEPPKDKDKQENEALAADAVQSVATVDLKPQAQVQPQQAVTSSEQGVVIEVDSPSPPPTSPVPTTTAL